MNTRTSVTVSAYKVPFVAGPAGARITRTPPMSLSAMASTRLLWPLLTAVSEVTLGPGSSTARAPRNSGGHPRGCGTVANQRFATGALPDTNTTKPFCCRKPGATCRIIPVS